MVARQLIDKPYELTSRERRLVWNMLKWSQEAACGVPNPDPGFLAERTNSGKKNAEQELSAKEICTACPVKMECLDHALKMPERGGIWGGLNDGERDELYKRLKKMNPREWTFHDDH